MEPVRVKLYGLVSVTRRGYLTQVYISVGLLALLLGIWWLQWPSLREKLGSMGSSGVDQIIAFCDAAGWVLLAIAAFLAIEVVVVLRAFARKGAAAKSQPPPSA